MVLLSLLTVNSYASSMSLSVSLADPAWDGKNVPVGQQCKKFGGEGSTPFLNVNQIPSGTNAIIMEYSDRTHRPMDCGGHGKFGYRILPGSSSVKVPSVAGHTFDLPQGFYLTPPLKCAQTNTISYLRQNSFLLVSPQKHFSFG